jgi:hypothetical protein
MNPSPSGRGNRNSGGVSFFAQHKGDGIRFRNHFEIAVACFADDLHFIRCSPLTAWRIQSLNRRRLTRLCRTEKRETSQKSRLQWNRSGSHGVLDFRSQVCCRLVSNLKSQISNHQQGGVKITGPIKSVP